MSCSKRYGGGAVYVTREDDFNTAITISSYQYLACQSMTMPALTRELIENQELRTDRFSNESYRGKQGDLSWELTITIPVNELNGMSLPPAYADLIWAAGFDGSVLNSSAVCNRTLQIVRSDRDGSLIEILNGCIVQQAVWTFSTTELCTLAFSGVASTKTELTGGAFIDGTDIDYASGTTSLDLSGILPDIRNSWREFFPDEEIGLPTGIKIQLVNGDGATELSTNAITSDSYTVVLSSALTQAINGVTAVYYKLPTPASTSKFTKLEPEGWVISVDDYQVPAKSATLTLETGLSYGELTAGDVVPTERLSGQAKVSGSISCYLDNEVLSRFSNDFDFKIITSLDRTITTTGHAELTEHPSFELSIDDAASGDFSFNCYGDNPITVFNKNS